MFCRLVRIEGLPIFFCGVTILGVVFKWPKVGTRSVNVNFELIVMLSIGLNMCHVGLAKDGLTKLLAEIFDAEKKLGRGIICERQGKRAKLAIIIPKVFVNCFL